MAARKKATLASTKTGEKRGVNFNPVSEILKAAVFVGRMLVVVVIRDRQPNHRRLVRLLEKIHRNTSADGREKDRLVPGCAHERGDLAREREIERSPGRQITWPPVEADNLRVLQTCGSIGRFAHDGVSLRLDVPFDERLD